MKIINALLLVCVLAGFAVAQDQATDTEVAPGLHLTSEALVWALQADSTPKQLLPIPHHDSELARQLGANILRSSFLLKQKMAFFIPGEKAGPRLHTAKPILYVQSTRAEENERNRPGSAYKTSIVLIRLEPAGKVRLAGKIDFGRFNLKPNTSQTLVPSTQSRFRDSQWIEIAPTEPLPPGEYAVVQVSTRPDTFPDWVFDFAVE